MSYAVASGEAAVTITTPPPVLTPAQEHALPEGVFPVIPTAVDLPFWEGLRREEILLQRCQSCQQFQWTPEIICHRCLSQDLDFEAIDTAATVYSWERVHRPVLPALREHCPYLVLVAALEQAPGVLMLGNHVGPGRGEADVAIGAALAPVFEHHPDYTLLQWRLTG